MSLHFITIDLMIPLFFFLFALYFFQIASHSTGINYYLWWQFVLIKDSERRFPVRILSRSHSPFLG